MFIYLLYPLLLFRGQGFLYHSFILQSYHSFILLLYHSSCGQLSYHSYIQQSHIYITVCHYITVFSAVLSQFHPAVTHVYPSFLAQSSHYRQPELKGSRGVPYPTLLIRLTYRLWHSHSLSHIVVDCRVDQSSCGCARWTHDILHATGPRVVV